jgi:hypothetical protein
MTLLPPLPEATKSGENLDRGRHGGQRLVVEVHLSDPGFFTQAFPRSRNECAPSAPKIDPFKCSPKGPTGMIRK